MKLYLLVAVQFGIPTVFASYLRYRLTLVIRNYSADKFRRKQDRIWNV